MIFCGIAGIPSLPENLDAWQSTDDPADQSTDGLQTGPLEDSSSEQPAEEQSNEEQEEDQPKDDAGADHQSAQDSSNEPDQGGGEETESAPAKSQEAPPESGEQIVGEDVGKWIMPATRVVVLSLAAVMAVGIMGTMLTALVASEAGRMSLMLAVIGPILAISQRGESGTFTKGRIQGYIEAHPGIHFSALRDALSLANGVTAHHLHALEKEGRIMSWLDSTKRRFASSGIDPKLLSRIEQPVVGMQQAILEVLDSAGKLGMKSGELRLKMETSRQLMSYHMKQLDERGLVQAEGRGKARKWKLLETGKAVLMSSQHL
jgi:predicted transcriptional regulator